MHKRSALELVIARTVSGRACYCTNGHWQSLLFDKRSAVELAIAQRSAVVLAIAQRSAVVLAIAQLSGVVLAIAQRSAVELVITKTACARACYYTHGQR